MGLFKKKKTVIDYDAMFKEQYKSINQITQQAHKYNELIDFIDQGAHFDKAHFEALRENAKKELQSIHQINQSE